MRRLLVAISFLAAVAGATVLTLPAIAARVYGPPANWLTTPQRIEYSARILWADGLLTRALEPDSAAVEFEVEPGESVASVCERLQDAGVVAHAPALLDYLVYTGQDTSLQAGSYSVSASMSAIEIAAAMQDATPAEVDFVVLAGWRIEEIAAALPTSGLEIAPEDFTRAAAQPHAGYEFLAMAPSTEGFLYPDKYVLSRHVTVDELLDYMIRNFALHVGDELTEGFRAQGLTVLQAVTLASIVQREAVRLDEAPLIASVYLNRMTAGLKLDADPTVQYALGFNTIQQTWWTNPLSLADLSVDSPYNTYLVPGLPPGPIASPGWAALAAIARPASSPNYYFSARCDGSGYHEFAVDFAQHLRNLCP